MQLEVIQGGLHCTGKTGEMTQKNPCQGKHREFGNFVQTQGKHRKFCQNTGNYFCSSGKCSDSKSKGRCYICCKKIISFFQKLDRSAIDSFVYVIVTNYVNWHRENLRSDRENTGNLKIQFEWVP